MSERTMKARQTYLDNIKASTGKTAEELGALARARGLSKSSQVVAWLKDEYGLGYGHAGMVWYLMAHDTDARSTPSDRLERLFTGKKARWYAPFEALAAGIRKFGSDVHVSANMTYINLLRGEKKFAIIQPSSADRLDVGIKLKGVDAHGRLEASGSWNPMVTHRVRIGDAAELDAELLGWLEQAYQRV